MSKRNGLFWALFPSLLTGVGCALLLALYWMTDFPSITWWVGSEYSLMAVCLGIAPAPGSLLLTLLGWTALQIPFGLSQAVVLNGLAGLIAAVTIFLTFLISRKLITDTQDEVVSPSEGGVKQIAMLSAVLLLGVSGTVWRYGIMFQPYILTGLFTSLILLTMVAWWRSAESDSANRWLFLILLLFGLDFSIHRTNLLLLPGLIVWILLRYPRTVLQFKSWVAGILGLMIGLGFQFGTMLLASFKPVFSADNAVTLTSFYEHISLKQAGGGWMVNLFPRKADFFSVQLHDYWRMMADNLFVTDGPLSYFGLLTIILLLLGVVALIRNNYKLFIGLVILFLCSSIGGVLYFNTPENYYWPMDRHYLPSFIILTIFLVVGAGRLALAAWNSTKMSGLVAAIVLVLLFALPVNSFVKNLPDIDASDRHFARDYATNILNNLEPDAILIVQGDVLWPILYMQVAENMRPDITLLSQSLLNTKWYPAKSLELDPNLPLLLTPEDLTIRPWNDTIIEVTVDRVGETDTVQIVNLEVPPTLAEKYLMVQDWLTVKMIRDGGFRRPIYFTSPIDWLMPHLRSEGLVWKVVPDDDPNENLLQLYQNLTTNYLYRGYENDNLTLDKSSAMIAQNLAYAHLMLAHTVLERGDAEMAETVMRNLETQISSQRFEADSLWEDRVTQLNQLIDRTMNPLPDSTMTE